MPAKKTAAPAKKVVPGNKPDLNNSKTVKKETSNKNKTVTAKAAPAPAKKSAPAKKEAPAPAKKPAAKAAPAPAPAPAKKAEAPAPAKKPAPTPAPATVPVAKKASKKAAAAKAPAKTVTTFAKTALPSRQSASASASSMPSKQATPTSSRDEKKSNIVIARRRLENKAKDADQGKTMINYQPDFNRSILDEPVQQSGPVYRYSDEELNEFRELIGGRLESARKELAYLQGLIMRKDEAGTEDTENRHMSMEDGSGAMEREQLAQLASRQIQFINHLEKALIRIENKTYGICRVTGKLIDKARLRAVPHATLSIEAKKTMSK
ncbi:MAG: TraR/DksA family transcriptional regulator [Sphingobacteriales bacterium]|nr:MAG: TraR/DksA family transcriptional regulator [Sphingobacteriales bacterium]